VKRVLPPGPFPPREPQQAADQDLAIRLRALFSLSGLERARPLLERRLSLAVDSQRFDQAAELLRAWLDSWPIAGMLPRAWSDWDRQPNGASLALLARAAELLRAAHGWQALPAGPWCQPDEAWLRREVGEGPWQIVRRAPGDGAERTAQDLGAALCGQRCDPETLLALPGDQLAGRRAELGRALARGQLLALRFTSPVPEDPASQLALGEVRMEGRSQAAYEAWGAAGLGLEQVPDWDVDLQPAPAGQAGERLRARCEGRFLPGPPGALAQGSLQRVGYLLWHGPHRPLAVHPAAVALLHLLDGQRDAQALAMELGAPLEAVREILGELVGLGAASAGA